MKKITFVSISILILAVVLFSTLFAAAKWEKVKSGSGVTVYTRDVAGSDMDEFKGVIVLNTHPAVFFAILQDIPNQVKWMHNCIESKLIEKKGDFFQVVYNVTDTPWPVTDRDVVVQSRVKLNQPKGTAIVKLKSVSDSRCPAKGGRVRMKSLVGSYQLYYLGKNKTKIVYSINANPGGSIPASLANMTSKDIPYNTLLGLRKMAKLSKYKADGEVLKKRHGDNWKPYK